MYKKNIGLKRQLIQMIILGLVLFSVEMAWASPKITFDEITHDFGNIIQGKSVSHAFKFKNIGDEKLIIKDVKAG